MKKLTENLTSKDRWTRIFARMQLIKLGRYKDRVTIELDYGYAPALAQLLCNTAPRDRSDTRQSNPAIHAIGGVQIKFLIVNL